MSSDKRFVRYVLRYDTAPTGSSDSGGTVTAVSVGDADGKLAMSTDRTSSTQSVEEMCRFLVEYKSEPESTLDEVKMTVGNFEKTKHRLRGDEMFVHRIGDVVTIQPRLLLLELIHRCNDPPDDVGVFHGQLPTNLPWMILQILHSPAWKKTIQLPSARQLLCEMFVQDPVAPHYLVNSIADEIWHQSNDTRHLSLYIDSYLLDTLFVAPSIKSNVETKSQPILPNKFIGHATDWFCLMLRQCYIIGRHVGQDRLKLREGINLKLVPICADGTDHSVQIPLAIECNLKMLVDTYREGQMVRSPCIHYDPSDTPDSFGPIKSGETGCSKLKRFLQAVNLYGRGNLNDLLFIITCDVKRGNTDADTKRTDTDTRDSIELEGCRDWLFELFCELNIRINEQGGFILDTQLALQAGYPITIDLIRKLFLIKLIDNCCYQHPLDYSRESNRAALLNLMTDSSTSLSDTVPLGEGKSRSSYTHVWDTALKSREIRELLFHCPSGINSTSAAADDADDVAFRKEIEELIWNGATRSGLPLYIDSFLLDNIFVTHEHNHSGSGSDDGRWAGSVYRSTLMVSNMGEPGMGSNILLNQCHLLGRLANTRGACHCYSAFHPREVDVRSGIDPSKRTGFGTLTMGQLVEAALHYHSAFTPAREVPSPVSPP